MSVGKGSGFAKSPVHFQYQINHIDIPFEPIITVGQDM